jgi:hypothetical protein
VHAGAHRRHAPCGRAVRDGRGTTPTGPAPTPRREVELRRLLTRRRHQCVRSRSPEAIETGLGPTPHRCGPEVAPNGTHRACTNAGHPTPDSSKYTRRPIWRAFAPHLFLSLAGENNRRSYLPCATGLTEDWHFAGGGDAAETAYLWRALRGCRLERALVTCTHPARWAKNGTLRPRKSRWFLVGPPASCRGGVKR